MQMFCCIFFLFYNYTIVAIKVMHLTSVQLVFPKAGTKPQIKQEMKKIAVLQQFSLYLCKRL